MPDTDVTISLTSDEALILFDVLHRWGGRGARKRIESAQENEGRVIDASQITAVLLADEIFVWDQFPTGPCPG